MSQKISNQPICSQCTLYLPSENVFRGYRKGALGTNGLRKNKSCPVQSFTIRNTKTIMEKEEETDSY